MIIWTEDKARAFVAWRRNDQAAHARSIDHCVCDPDICERFEQWYAVQRLLGKRKVEG